MRRGEALALRWRDVDPNAGRIAVQRSLGVVRTKGQGEEGLPLVLERLLLADQRPGTRSAGTLALRERSHSPSAFAWASSRSVEVAPVPSNPRMRKLTAPRLGSS